MKTKRILSLLLAVVMMLALSVSSFAADTYPDDATFSVTIPNQVAGYEYSAYQIFKGDLVEKTDETTKVTTVTLSNIQWGDSISVADQAELYEAANAYIAEKYKEDAKKDEKIFTVSSAAEFAEKFIEGNEMEAEDLADFLSEYISDTAYQSVNTQTNTTEVLTPADGDKEAVYKKAYVLEDMVAGYYLIKNTVVPGTLPTDEQGNAYTDYILQVVRDVNVSPKASVPTVDKTFAEGGKVNEKAIGDTVNYKIVGTLPSTLDTYDTYYYEFSDTLSGGLDFDAETVKVTVNDVDVTDYFFVEESDETKGAITVSIEDLLALSLLDDPDVGEIKSTTQVILTYSATLNTNATIGANDNTVKVIYSNDPNVKGKGTEQPHENPDEPTPPTVVGETPKSTVTTYTTQITVLKVDENGKGLEGAAFKLTGGNRNIVITTGEVYVENTDGTYYKLKNGSYTATAPVVDTTDASKDTSDQYADVEKKYTKEIKVYAVKGHNYIQDSEGTYYLLNDGTYTETEPTTETAKNYTGYNETTKEYTMYKDAKLEAEGFVSKNGDNYSITFTGLGTGTYTLTETVTPDGYNTCDDLEFTVSFDTDTKAYTVTSPADIKDATSGEVTASAVTVSGSTLSTTVVNNSGSVLPSTGGIGTTIFYIAGAVLVLGAAILLITKKRMGENA